MQVHIHVGVHKCNILLSVLPYGLMLQEHITAPEQVPRFLVEVGP